MPNRTVRWRPFGSKLAELAHRRRSRALDSAFEAARSKRGRRSLAKKVMGPRSKLYVAMKAGKMMRGGS